MFRLSLEHQMPAILFHGLHCADDVCWRIQYSSTILVNTAHTHRLFLAREDQFWLQILVRPDQFFMTVHLILSSLLPFLIDRKMPNGDLLYHSAPRPEVPKHPSSVTRVSCSYCQGVFSPNSQICQYMCVYLSYIFRMS